MRYESVTNKKCRPQYNLIFLILICQKPFDLYSIKALRRFVTMFNLFSGQEYNQPSHQN